MKVVVSQQSRLPVVGNRKSGIGATGVPKAPPGTIAVRNPDARKPKGT